jgi:DNA-binding IclR family transcriptional regulator
MPTVNTADKVMDILEAIAAEGQGVGTREMARRLEMNVATVHNIARTLQARGYLRQNPQTKRFEIGSRLMLISRHSQYLNALSRAGKSIVQQVATTLDESIMLAALDHGHVVNLHYIPGSGALRVAEPEDITEVAHCTASGKLMLAQMTSDELLQYLDHYKLKNHTPQTITRRSVLVEEINQIRQKGFSLSCDELCDGVSALAVPINDPWGKVIAAIGAGVPTVRMNQAAYRKTVLQTLTKAASDITINLA